MLFKYIQSWKKVVSNFTSSAMIFALSVLLFACNQTTKELPLFEALSAEQTGIQFENKLHPNEQFNMFHYMYYYNGAGVGTGASVATTTGATVATSATGAGAAQAEITNKPATDALNKLGYLIFIIIS